MTRRSGHTRPSRIGAGRTLRVHQRLRTGKRLVRDALPTPESLGVQSLLEVKVYLVLKKHGIPFRTQVAFDGGSALFGGQRADFVLPGYGGTASTGTVIEALGPWHNLPGAQMRDERKWENRRRAGWNVVTIKESQAVTLEQCERILMDKLGIAIAGAR